MMRLSRSLCLSPLLAAALFTGCTPTPPKPTAAPAPMVATPEQASMVQAEIVKAVPGSVVGHVAGVNSTQAAVSFGNPAPAMKKGDSIQFTDANSMPIANGTFFSLDVSNPDYPMVIVDIVPTTGGRAPVKGDLAIFMPK